MGSFLAVIEIVVEGGTEGEEAEGEAESYADCDTHTRACL